MWKPVVPLLTRPPRQIINITRLAQVAYRLLPVRCMTIFKKFKSGLNSRKESKYLKKEIARLAWLNEIRKADQYNYTKFIMNNHLSELEDVGELIRFTNEDMMDFGYSKELLIVECTMDRTMCKSTWFEKTTNNKYGNCYTFNGATGRASRDVVISRKVGSAYGLRLTLNINSTEYIGYLASQYGVRISIQSANVIPQPEEFGVDIFPGTTITIGIRRTEMNRVKAPYITNCTLEFPKKYTGYVDRMTEYSVDLCLTACKSYYLYQKCGCIQKNQNLASSPNVKRRDTFNAIERVCELEVDTLLHLPTAHKLSLKCNCQPSCKEVMFQPSISIAKWPAESYQKIKILDGQVHLGNMLLNRFIKGDDIDSNVDDNVVNKNLVRLHVYYETFTYKLIVESPLYPISQLWADIGGVIGFYLGMTVVSFIELLELIVLLCYYFCVLICKKTRHL